MKKLVIFSSLFVLTACLPVKPDNTPIKEPASTGEIADNRPLEQVPEELSLTHFRNMQLEGTGLTLQSILADNSAYTRYQIAYKSNGLTISGVMNIPKGEGPFPLVILNHGHISPAIYTVGRGLKREQDYLAREGFAVLHTDYRGHGESDVSPDTREVYDAGLEYSMDSINAINAVQSAHLPQVDATRVGMLGHSLGGGVTLNVATAHPEMVDAIVLYASVHSDAWENFMRWRNERDEGDRTRAALGTRESNPENWDALSSLTHLKNIDDPVLIFHGTADSDVPIEWSEFLDEKLTELGKNFTFVTYEGEKHEFIRQWSDFMRKTSAFFKDYLTPASDTSTIYDPQRITNKPFGILITPQDSPVQPERFRGYHTGTDFEIMPGEDETQIVVSALCDGTILFADRVNGYGGVIVQSCSPEGEPVTVLYGHLSISSFAVEQGSNAKKGMPIAKLGEGYSQETDGERPHLHLAIHRGTDVELKGYVQSEKDLGAWINPLDALE